MATKRVPITIHEMADMIKDYYVIERGTEPPETLRETLKDPRSFFYYAAQNYLERKGIDFTKEEYSQALQIIQQDN